MLLLHGRKETKEKKWSSKRTQKKAKKEQKRDTEKAA